MRSRWLSWSLALITALIGLLAVDLLLEVERGDLAKLEPQRIFEASEQQSASPSPLSRLEVEVDRSEKNGAHPSSRAEEEVLAETGAAAPADAAAAFWRRSVDAFRKHLPKELIEASEVELAEVEDLSLHGKPITDAELELLAELMPNLRRLNLRGTQVTDAGLVHLAALDLELLELRGTTISGQSLFHLAGSRLENLQLCDTGVSDSDLHLLPSLPHLKTLKLNFLRVGDESVGVLGAFSTLRHLEIDGTDITGVGLGQILQAHPHLERIELRGAKVSADELARLRESYPACELIGAQATHGALLGGYR